MNTSKDEWAIWAAVSSGPQARDDKASIPEQVRLAKEAAEKFGGNVRDENILVVPGKSRHIVLFEEAARKMEAYAKLQKLLEERAIQVLAYWSEDRLGRKASLIMAVKGLCRQAGVQLYEVSNPPHRIDGAARRSNDSEMLGAIKSVGAESEVAELMRRHEFGMIGRARAGKLPTGRPSWGYTLRYETRDGKPFPIVEIDESKAYWVRKIFEWYCQGASGRTIAARLNEKGVPLPEAPGPWSGLRVFAVLGMAYRYAGYSEMNRRSKAREYVRAKGTWPPLITEDTLQTYLRERKMRSINRRLADTPYLLTGVCWCWECKRPFHLEGQYPKRAQNPPKMYVRLNCKGAHPLHIVSHTRVAAQLREILPVLDKLDQEGVLPGQELAPTLRRSVEIQEAAIADIEAQIQRAHRAYIVNNLEEGEYTSWVFQLRQKLEGAQSEMQSLLAQLEEEEVKGTRQQRLEEVVEKGVQYIDAGGAIANQWLRSRLRVWIEKGKVSKIDIL
jgi:DNA invertase Pin-like site-specific DNA recombinase